MGGFLVGCSANQEDANQYAEFIKDRNNSLGQAIILHGRLLEGFSVNKQVLDSDDFIAAEQILEDKLVQVGNSQELKALELPADSKAVRELHRLFMEANSYLRSSVQSVTDGGYAPQFYLKAEQEWDASREAYLKFSRRLSKMSGQELTPQKNTENPPRNTEN